MLRTPRERFDANIAALDVLANAHERDLTPTDLASLSLYEGWADARVRMFGFDVTGHVKPALRTILDKLDVDPNSLVSAGGLTQYFTPPTLVSTAITVATHALDRTPTRILEPSAGTGRFLAELPPGLAIEPDPILSEILRLRFPAWQVRRTTLENAGLTAQSFDLVIGNAPFGDWGVSDSFAPPDLRRRHLQAKVHDYFLCKAVSLLIPGGIVAMITHHSTMDRKETGVREWLSERAELVAMWRLPAELWDAQGASPMADLVVMRRR